MTCLTTPEAFDAAYAEAIRLVHTHRAASISLVQRYLRIGYEPARVCWPAWFAKPRSCGPCQVDSICMRLEPLASELKALHGFVTDILLSCERGTLDAQAVRQIGLKHALLDYVQRGREPRPTDRNDPPRAETGTSAGQSN
ncbi:DNA translocase FtsK [Cupriavidus basilensis]